MFSWSSLHHSFAFEMFVPHKVMMIFCPTCFVTIRLVGHHPLILTIANLYVVDHSHVHLWKQSLFYQLASSLEWTIVWMNFKQVDEDSSWKQPLAPILTPFRVEDAFDVIGSRRLVCDQNLNYVVLMEFQFHELPWIDD